MREILGYRFAEVNKRFMAEMMQCNFSVDVPRWKETSKNNQFIQKCINLYDFPLSSIEESECEYYLFILFSYTIQQQN